MSDGLDVRPSAEEIQAFFETHYPDVEDGYLALSYPHPTRKTRQGKAALASVWFDLKEASWQKIAHAAAQLAVQRRASYPSCGQAAPRLAH